MKGLEFIIQQWA